jgi:hypothetical protein
VSAVSAWTDPGLSRAAQSVKIGAED